MSSRNGFEIAEFEDHLRGFDEKNKTKRDGSISHGLKYCADHGMTFWDGLTVAFDVEELQRQNAKLRQEVDETNRAGDALADQLQARDYGSMRDFLKRVWGFPQMRIMLLGLLLAVRMALAFQFEDYWRYSLHASIATAVLGVFLFIKFAMAESARHGFGLLFLETAVFIGSLPGMYLAFKQSPGLGFASVAVIVALLSSRLWEKLAASDAALVRLIKGAF